MRQCNSRRNFLSGQVSELKCVCSWELGYHKQKRKREGNCLDFSSWTSWVNCVSPNSKSHYGYCKFLFKNDILEVSKELQKSHWKSTRSKIKKTHFLFQGSNFDLPFFFLPLSRNRGHVRRHVWHSITRLLQPRSTIIINKMARLETFRETNDMALAHIASSFRSISISNLGIALITKVGGRFNYDSRGF